MPRQDSLARRYAEQIAAELEVEIGSTPAYTYAETGQAAAWPLVGNVHGARLAVNVEDDSDPYGVVEIGPLDNPRHEMFLVQSLGYWVEADSHCLGPNLLDAQGADHPVLRVL